MSFDLFRGKDRVLQDEFRSRCDIAGIRHAAYVADGPSPVPVDVALKRLGEFGQHGSAEPVEGVVYRCEREGRVDFLAKWVRPDKVDGKYLATSTDAPSTGTGGRVRLPRPSPTSTVEGCEMGGISMCRSQSCPARRECYRNEASGTRPSEFRQAWIAWTWWQPGGVGALVECDGFWPAPAPLASLSRTEVE